VANFIRGRQAAQVAGFTLGARNKETHARTLCIGGVDSSVHPADGNNRERRDCKQQVVKFHKIPPSRLCLVLSFMPAPNLALAAELNRSLYK
jgi:hypothetical protein